MKWMSLTGVAGIGLLLVGCAWANSDRPARVESVDCAAPLTGVEWSVPAGGTSAYNSVEGYTARYAAYQQITACHTFAGAPRADVENVLGEPTWPLNTAYDETSQRAEYVIGKEFGSDYTLMVIDYDWAGRVKDIRTDSA